MERGRNLGLALVLSSGLAFAAVATAPAAFASAAPAGSSRAFADLQPTAFHAEPSRGDYQRGYDEGRQQGVQDGTHDADVDCQQHKKMSARDAGEYQRGWSPLQRRIRVRVRENL